MDETDLKPTWTPQQQDRITKIERALRYAINRAQEATDKIMAVEKRLLMIEQDLLEKIKGQEH